MVAQARKKQREDTLYFLVLTKFHRLRVTEIETEEESIKRREGTTHEMKERNL